MWILRPPKPRFTLDGKWFGPALITSAIALVGWTLLRAPWRALFTSQTKAAAPSIAIHVDNDYLRHLQEVGARAVQQGMLIPSDHDAFPARVEIGGQNHDATIRLKGRWPDHFSSPKKLSFRVTLKDGARYRGMREFSLQSPAIRNFIWEWVFQQAYFREKGIAVIYDFVHLAVNGSDWGVYALEESPDFSVLAHNQRRDGPIVKFDSDRYWRELQAEWHDPKTQNTDSFISGYGFSSALPIVPLSLERTLKDETLFKSFQVAQDRLDGFRRKRLSSSEVFDVPLMATLLALCDLFGTDHGLHTNQYRLYFNPVTALLEPIAYDNNPGALLQLSSFERSQYDWRLSSAEGGGKGRFLARLFEDQAFYAAYIRALETFSTSAYLDNLFRSLEGEMGSLQALLETEWPAQKGAFAQVRAMLSTNQRRLRDYLSPAHALMAYVEKREPRRLTIRLASTQTLPVRVEALRFRDAIVAEPVKAITLPGKIRLRILDYRNFVFESKTPVDWDLLLKHGLKVSYSILGRTSSAVAPVYPWRLGGTPDGVIAGDPTREIMGLPFFRLDVEHKHVTFAPGRWRIDRLILVPQGFLVSAGPETHLKFVGLGSLVSYSPLDFRGPITIEGSPGGRNGIVVIGAQRKSHLEKVTFSSLGPPRDTGPGRRLTGAVTFYQSAVDIVNCTFTRNLAGDDALNLIRSPFVIRQSRFTDALADALDIDFSNGEITDTTFTRIGVADRNGDAIDLSGSNVTLRNVSASHVQDKGISVGEASQVNAGDINIRRADIGIAVKDASFFEGERLRITQSRIGIGGYVKKSTFGPSRIRVAGLDLKENKEDRSLEPGTSYEAK